MDTPHLYSIYLNANDPIAKQPQNIIRDLKPHQLTSLYKCIQMEQQPHITYNVNQPENIILFPTGVIPTFRGIFDVHANVGVIGDIVGYGKTLIALSIVAENSLDKIYIDKSQIHSYGSSFYSGNMTVVKQKQSNITTDEFIHTTLVVVPRGPVFVQWTDMIEKDTKLKYLTIDSLHKIKKDLPKTFHELKEYLETFDLILIKNTTLKVWCDYLENFKVHLWGFDRIMIDEAHDIIYRIPRFHFRYLWLITSSYRALIHYNYSKSIFNHIDLLINTERIHYLLVKNETDYIQKSFNIPEPKEEYYLCRMNKRLSALTQFVSSSIRDKININDIAGAVQELGGNQETENSLIESVQKNFSKDILNKEKEIAYIQSLELETDQKELRLKNAYAELQRLQSRLESLTERLNDISTKNCPICMELLEDPIYLNCTHTICGKCLFQWANSSVHTRYSAVICPECRTPIDSEKIVAIIKDTTQQNIPIKKSLPSKEEMFIDIILKKPHGKFLLFSRLDSQFYRLCILLTQHNITHSEIKGNTNHMMNILKDFNDGKIRVILLNTFHAGCGIDISSATDVIIYHKMNNEKIQAVGRAQRVGRTSQLTIHNLCYPQELDEHNTI